MQRTVKKLTSAAVSAFASLCLALALVPAAAFATASTSGTLSLLQDSVEVTAGGSTVLTDLVTVECDGDYHLDFVADEAASGYFTVNKHSGTLVATAATDGLETLPTVTVYLLDDEKGSGNSGKPCDGFNVLAQQTITVSVAASEATSYGYQGSGFTIYLTSPSVTGTVADGTTYTNTLEAQTAGSTVTFTYEQSAGLNQYSNFSSTWGYASATAAYKALAGQYISYEDAAGDVTTLAESEDAEVTALSTTTVSISIPVGDAEGTGVLSFDADLHTFQQSDTSTVNKSLGVDISFAFEIAAADDSEGDDSDGDADGTDTDDGTSDDGTTDDTTGDATDDSGTADDITGDATDDSGTADDTTGDATDDASGDTGSTDDTTAGDTTDDGTTDDTTGDSTDTGVTDDTTGDATDDTGTTDATDDASGDTGTTDDATADDATAAAIELSSANVTLAYAKTAYTGKKLTPAVTVKVSGVKLVKGTDYTVSYSNNKAIGKAKVTVTGTGSYEGTVTKTFKIVPKKASVKSATKSKAKKKLTVKWAKVAGGVTKYQVRYRVKGTSKWKSVTVKASKSSTTLKKLKSGKKYQVQVRAYKTVSGTKYYGAWSTVKTVKVK